MQLSVFDLKYSLYNFCFECIKNKRTSQLLVNYRFSRPLHKKRRKDGHKFQFHHSADPPSKNKKQTMKHESDCDTNCSWYPWNRPQRPGKETGGSEDQKKS